MLTGLKSHFCCFAAAFTVAIALVFSTVSMGSAVDSGLSIGLTEQVHAHHDSHGGTFSAEHQQDDASPSEGNIGQSHGHSPDHSHEVPAFLDRSMIVFMEPGQKWQLLLTDRGVIDNRPILERPPRAISIV